jgi:hypothetical protein
MNAIWHVRHLAGILAGLAGVLLASAAAVPAAFAGTNPIPDPPGHIGDPYIGTMGPVPSRRFRRPLATGLFATTDLLTAALLCALMV